MGAERWDVVIVGAGSSGSVLASRLGSQGNLKVLLIEAGSETQQIEDFPEEIHSAHVVAGARAERSFNRIIPGQITGTREFAATRGRILGGSSATNGGYFIRPTRADLDEWEAAGSALWGYNSALLSLQEMERDLTYGATSLHGDSGLIPVSRTSLDSPKAQTFHHAARELGFTDHLDMNDFGPDGFGAVPTNTVGDQQYSTAITYLGSEARLPGLTIWTETTVERVLFNGTTAVGVSLSRNGASEEIFAGEIVLSAGALITPQLLMLSGIGPADELTRRGIPVVSHSPHVGKGLSDHPQLAAMWMPAEKSEYPEGSWMGGVLHAQREAGELEALQSIRSLSELVGGEPDASTALLLATVSPRRTGHLSLVSASIADSTFVHYNYLEDPEVRADLRSAARLAYDLLSTEAVTSNCEWSWGPTPEDVKSDNQLDAWIFDNVATSMHACATASFAGPEPVVDPEGNVLGVKNLRIADTSILPAAPRRGPAVAALLIGELIAQTMLSERS
jgi:choline dehydrogenase-like flavoprotein